MTPKSPATWCMKKDQDALKYFGMQNKDIAEGDVLLFSRIRLQAVKHGNDMICNAICK